MIGLIIGLIVLWIRPEYRFLLFYIVANNALVLLFSAWSLTAEQWPVYLTGMLLGDLIFAAIGAPFIALRKWLKTRKTGRDKQLDQEMERIRAEIAAREGARQ